MITRRVAGAGLVALVVWSLSACTDDGPLVAVTRGSDEPVPPSGEVVEVRALDNTFDPPRIVIAPGTEVRWVNAGQNDHNVVPVDGDGWGVDTADFGPGASYGDVFAIPGEYPYYCTLHGTPTAGMVGVIVVESPDVAATETTAPGADVTTPAGTSP